MHILLVEDEPYAQKSLELLLAKADMNVRSTAFGMEAVQLARLGGFDLIVLDLGLPDLSGQAVLEQLRSARVTTPVLILSGDDTLASRLQGFGLGADDYLTKPYNRDELLARVRAVARRARGPAAEPVRCGRLSVLFDTKTAEVDGRPVALTAKEYQILEALALRKGSMLTKDMFLKHLYQGADEPELKIIDVFICKLRKKIATLTGGESYIDTVWGRGYTLREPEAVALLPAIQALA